MAKAVFHKNQRVYVKPVGTWALVEHVVPHWAKGLDEPLRIHYDVGMGREFAAEELECDRAQQHDVQTERWRVVRTNNRWQSAQETSSHPFPGTYPVVATSDAEWGGWRVPGAEYALSPTRIEYQARLVASAPAMAMVLKELLQWAENSHDIPPELREPLRRSADILAYAEDVAG